MIEKLKAFWQRSEPAVAALSALLGGIFFIYQAYLRAHGQASVLDEGAYLYKGYLFASGQYQPFEPYGPWTNHMPFSFLIPGYLQLWLGTGIRTARYAAVTLAFIGLVSFWVMTRRLAGKWWAAGVVWAIALNPALIKLYSISASQGLVFFLLGLSLALTLGEEKPFYQIVLGALIAGALLLTRINLSPVYFLLLVYIFWQHGKKAGLWAAGVSFVFVLYFHVLYSPGIFDFWGKKLPGFITDAVVAVFNLNPPMIPGEIATKVWDPGQVIDANTRIGSLVIGTQVHFLELISFLVVLLLWQGRKTWKSETKFRTSLFLGVAFIALFLTHSWAALGQDYCVYCFESYLSFFSPLALVLLAVTLSTPLGKEPAAKWRQVFLVLAVVGGIAWFGKSEYWRLARNFLRSDIPRFSGITRQAGTISVWGFIENIVGWNYDQSFVFFTWLTGSLLAGLIVLITLLVLKAFRGAPGKLYPFSISLLIISLSLGAVVSDSVNLAGYNRIYDCRGDVIESYEAVGASLKETIPPGSQIFWRGGLSAAPLLYITDSRAYFQLINGSYSRFIGGDTETLLMLGRWNEVLEAQWLREADFLLVAQEFMGGLEDYLESSSYILVATTPTVIDCRQNGPIYIFENQGN